MINIDKLINIIIALTVEVQRAAARDVGAAAQASTEPGRPEACASKGMHPGNAWQKFRSLENDQDK